MLRQSCETVYQFVDIADHSVTQFNVVSHVEIDSWKQFAVGLPNKLTLAVFRTVRRANDWTRTLRI